MEAAGVSAMKWGPCEVAVEISKEELYMQRAYRGKNRWPERGWGMAESDDMGSWPLYP